PLDTLQTLRDELHQYSPALTNTPATVVLTKKDTWQDTDWLAELKKEIPEPLLAISSVTREGLEELKEHIWQELQKEAAEDEE
ncbi:MAG: hypothetical protein GWO08_20080, partial [Gammaproteobacteria bacterium]|nr:hypothetical protein [Gammaproteobacteria bacterium]NIX01133.1 hypothetical protein [Phycisphaerae bacterium]